MRAIVARPPGPGPFAAVVAFAHVGGLTETMRIMARKVAAGGYVCVVPDLYHRLGTIVIDPQSHDGDVVAIRKIAAASVTEAGAMSDAGAVLAWLGSRPDVRGPHCATIGFGRGGSLAVRAASAFPGEVRAAASVLGFGFAPQGPEAATAALAGIGASLYCAFAERDDIIPASEHETLAAILHAARPRRAARRARGRAAPLPLPGPRRLRRGGGGAGLAGDLRDVRAPPRRRTEA